MQLQSKCRSAIAPTFVWLRSQVQVSCSKMPSTFQTRFKPALSYKLTLRCMTWSRSCFWIQVSMWSQTMSLLSRSPYNRQRRFLSKANSTSATCFHKAWAVPWPSVGSQVLFWAYLSPALCPSLSTSRAAAPHFGWPILPPFFQLTISAPLEPTCPVWVAHPTPHPSTRRHACCGPVWRVPTDTSPSSRTSFSVMRARLARLRPRRMTCAEIAPVIPVRLLSSIWTKHLPPLGAASRASCLHTLQLTGRFASVYPWSLLRLQL